MEETSAVFTFQGTSLIERVRVQACNVGDQVVDLVNVARRELRYAQT
jgi:hypothetical protein